ncbi:hypothetical protein Oweho_0014 [Owenweeksia hongkongensis DSM 17368]|uniref:Uncharacterized protein n=2 Tax=Owenweeksia TaxID=267986 RepID=G8R530_OWEHD|nr:hypothetical protein Oweho_0014 [Owenweeksia hongkongensis DSM 17368]
MTNGWLKFYRSLLQWEWYSDTNVVRLYLHLLLTANYEDKPWKGITIKAGSTIISWNKLSLQLGLSTQQLRTAMNKLERSKTISRSPTNKYQVITINNWHEMQGSENIRNSFSSNCNEPNPPENSPILKQITNDKPTSKINFPKQTERQYPSRASALKSNSLTNTPTSAVTSQQPEVNNQSTTIKEIKKQQLKEFKKEEEHPSLEDFEKFGFDQATKMKMTVDPTALRAKYYSWTENHWKTGKNKKITNWKATLINTLPFIQKEKSSEKKEKIDFNQNQYTL